MRKKAEVLAPAGSYESLKAAVCAGADAVYMGGTRFGARAYAENPDAGMLLDAIDYVHIHGRRLYLTVNTLLKDKELAELYEYLLPYYTQGLDGVIVQDVGVLHYIRNQFPKLPVHASTQMTITSAYGAAFLKDMGVERIVPARELSLAEIRSIKEVTGLEIECFVHGALCYCYSGQCLLSSLLGGRSGNRGQCAQPCRLPYQTDGKRPEDLMSLKDLCTIDLLPDILDAGVDSLKIEGRMKQPDYVYTVVSMYRKYVDLFAQYGREAYSVSDGDRTRLLSAYQRRGYSDGYYTRHNGREMISFNRPEPAREEKVKHPDYKVQEKVNGKFILSVGKRAKLILEHDGCTVSCEGAMAEEALKQPMDQSKIEKQIRKTGGTGYAFADLDICMEGNLFLPVQSLNQLRREALDLLTDRVLKPYKRETVCKKELPVQTPDRGERDRPLFSASVSSAAQLKAVLFQESAASVYVDCSIGFSNEVRKLLSGNLRRNVRCYLSMPYIFREAAAAQFEICFPELVKWYDGVLIRNFESYQWLIEKDYGKKIISDYNIYLFNACARDFLNQTRIHTCTAPVELNLRELKELGLRDCVYIAYGCQPVMITANCIQKTTGQCTRKERVLFLEDRYHKKFAVKNVCKYCYNVIYNSAPLMPLSQAEEILKLNPRELRLDFTVESAEETERILSLYLDVFHGDCEADLSGITFTNGHLKRGVK